MKSSTAKLNEERVPCDNVLFVLAEFSLRGKTAQYLQSKNGFFEQQFRITVEQKTVLGSQFNVSKPTEKRIRKY